MAKVTAEASEPQECLAKEFCFSNKVPRYVDFMDEFPMNAAGKILKYKLREDLAAKYAAKN